MTPVDKGPTAKEIALASATEARMAHDERSFVIEISTDAPDAEDLVRSARQLVADAVAWPADRHVSIEARSSDQPPAYLGGHEMEPGQCTCE